MFTLEESTLLRRMLHVIAWVMVAVLIGGCWTGVHWIRHRHDHHATRSA